MSDATLVWISEGRLSMTPPGGLLWHRLNGWATTRCGRDVNGARRMGARQMVAVRLDTARLIARPCPRCHRQEEER